MPKFGLKYNGSGYRDETAYRAMVGLAKPGEIWTARNEQEEVLILNNHGGWCNCLTMTDKAVDKRCLEVVGEQYVMYTNPGMVKYLFSDLLNWRVDRISPQGLEDIRGEVAEALGLRGAVGQKAELTHEQKCHALLDEILKGMKAE